MHIPHIVKESYRKNSQTTRLWSIMSIIDTIDIIGIIEVIIIVTEDMKRKFHQRWVLLSPSNCRWIIWWIALIYWIIVSFFLNDVVIYAKETSSCGIDHLKMRRQYRENSCPTFFLAASFLWVRITRFSWKALRIYYAHKLGRSKDVRISSYCMKPFLLEGSSNSFT